MDNFYLFGLSRGSSSPWYAMCLSKTVGMH